MIQINWSFLRACFLAGAVGSAVAYFMAPQLWWIGLLSGFAAGYLGYEFRETLSATSKVAQTSGTIAAVLAWGIVAEFRRTDPATRIVYVFWLLTTFGLATAIAWNAPHKELEFWIYGWILLLFVSVMASTFVSALLSLITSVLILLGARVAAREYWDEYNLNRLWMFGGTDDIKKAQERGFTRKDFTYSNIVRWVLLGFGVVLWFFLFYMWYWIITREIPEMAKMLWQVVKLIHSKERVLCGLDGAVGGAIAYLFFTGMLFEVGITSPIAVILLGGLSGAVLGTVHWRLSRLVFGPKLTQ